MLSACVIERTSPYPHHFNTLFSHLFFLTQPLEEWAHLRICMLSFRNRREELRKKWEWWNREMNSGDNFNKIICQVREATRTGNNNASNEINIYLNAREWRRILFNEGHWAMCILYQSLFRILIGVIGRTLIQLGWSYSGHALIFWFGATLNIQIFTFFQCISCCIGSTNHEYVASVAFCVV